jgi:methionine-rich copper-binding protein CopC
VKAKTYMKIQGINKLRVDVHTSLILAVFVVALSAAAALAHAHLLRATPAENASVPPPSEVTLQFSEPLERAFSAIVVRDATGRQVDKRDTRLDHGVTLRVALPPLAAGQYRVEWRAVAADSHKMQGGYAFRVSP